MIKRNRKQETGNRGADINQLPVLHFLPSRRGFTLIELIVVIAIIAMLASIVLLSLSDAQIRGRNTGVIQQVSEYQKAFGLYIANDHDYIDVGNELPYCVGSGSTDCVFAGDAISPSNSFSPLEEFIPGLPFVKTLTLTSGSGTYSGLIYICNDPDCRTAHFYWPEINVDSCTKGHTYYEGTNGVLCTEIAEGGSN